MDLSNDLISKFVKITNDGNKKETKEGTVYGTTVEYDGAMYVKIDGSDLLTPIDTTADIKEDERVTIMIKDHNATVTGNITSPSASSADVKKVTRNVEEIEGEITEFEAIIADVVHVGELDAEVARIDELIAGKATIEDLTATNAEITNLKAKDAEIENLVANKADITYLDANFATIDELKATHAEIEILDAEVASIDTLVNGNLTSDNILSFHVTADKVTMEDAFIKDAMISNVSAGKITSGSINTSLVSVQSEDGALTINGSTQQFKDADGNVRIQIGKDATGDFTFALYGEDGQGQLINQNGITASAIEDGLIVDKMVADNAAISGGKLDISSVITEINNDDSTTIKSNKIYLDEQNQSLEVAFKSLKYDLNNLSIGGNNLIRNSTFLEGAEAWGMVGNASVDSTTTPYPSVLINESDNTSNTWAGAASYGQGATKIDMHSGDVYVMSCYVYVNDTSSLDNGLGLSIKGKNTSGSDVEIHGVILTASELTPQRWTRITKVVYLQNEYTDCYIYGYVRRNGLAWFSRFQLEKGNTVTEWRLSDADLEAEINSVTEKVASNTTQIEVNKESINTLVAEDTIIKEQIVDLNGDVVEVNETLTAKYASLEQSVNGFKTEVADTYTTKTEFNGLEIGGANLVRNSTFDLGTEYWGLGSGCSLDTTTVPYPSVLSQQSGLTSNQWKGCTCSYLPNIETTLAEGDTYTVSCYYYINDTSTLDYGLGIAVKGTNTSGSVVEIAGTTVTELVSKKWVRIHKTFTLSSTYTGCYIFAYVKRNGTAWFNRFQLEKGNKLTDWQLSTVDLQTQIDDTNTNLKTNYSTTETMNSAINQKASEITTSVSQTYTTKTEFNNLEIGGRNLIHNGNFRGAIPSATYMPNPWTFWGNEIGIYGSQGMSGYNYDGCVYVGCNLTDGNSAGFYSNRVHVSKLEKGVTYMASFLFGKESNVINATAYLEYLNDTCDQIVYSQVLTTAEVVYDHADLNGHQYHIPFTMWTGEFSYLQITFNHGGTYAINSGYLMVVGNVQIERGNKVTDWTPAPEDTEEQISVVSSSLSQTATELTATFTDMHNGGYSQGVTKINKDGINVSQTDYNGWTSITASGFYVNNGSEDVIQCTTSGLIVKGNITATSGKIANFTISGNDLIGSNVGMGGASGGNYAFWAGSNTSSSAPFRVGHDGALRATNADITGTINATAGTFSGNIVTNNIVKAYNSVYAGAEVWGGYKLDSSGSYVSSQTFTIHGSAAVQIDGNPTRISSVTGEVKIGDASSYNNLRAREIYAQEIIYTDDLRTRSASQLSLSSVSMRGSNAFIEFSSGYGVIRVPDVNHLYLQTGGGAANTSSEVRCTAYKDASTYVNLRAHNLCAQNAVYANGVNVSSDRDRKRDIELYETDALSEICTTPVYAYHLDTDLDEEVKRIGIIMQEAPLDAIDLSGKGVDLYQMVTMLWRAVQQQQEMINELKGE